MRNEHTPGPWEMDSLDCDGEYGSGEDTHSGFKTFGVYDGKGHLLFDATNRDNAVSEIQEEDDHDSVYAWDELAKRDIRLAAAAPELLAALQGVLRVADRATDEFDAARAAIKKATS